MWSRKFGPVVKVDRLKREAIQNEDTQERCCQTNANQSQFFYNLNALGCSEAAPLGQSGGTVQLKI
jgi:hypothetical protein